MNVITFADDFMEAGDVNIGSHTAEVGGGWNNWNGAVTVLGATDRTTDTGNGSGNRANCKIARGTPNLDIWATLNFSAAALATPAVLFPGIGWRHSANNNNDGYEFTYQGTGLMWELDENGNSVDTLADTMPTGTVLIHVVARPSLHIIYVDGVEKIRRTTDLNPSTGKFVSLMHGNFGAIAGGNTSFIDDFSVAEWPGPSPSGRFASQQRRG
jgi:hypothetical protein